MVSRAELRSLGYTDQLIKRRILHGRLHRIHRGVYAVGSARLTLDGRRMAAVLACGDGALLSHRDAARLHGVLRSAGSGDWHVSAPRLRLVPGVLCHVNRHPDPRDATRIAGIPVTSLERTYLDLSADLTGPRLRDALEEGQRKDIVDLRRLLATIARSPGHHGIGPLREALATLGDYAPLVRSKYERLFLVIVRAAGLPEPSMNVDVAGVTVDSVWLEHKLVVEIDDVYSHGLYRDRAEDSADAMTLILAGFRIARIEARRLEGEPTVVAAELQALLSMP